MAEAWEHFEAPTRPDSENAEDSQRDSQLSLDSSPPPLEQTPHGDIPQRRLVGDVDLYDGTGRAGPEGPCFGSGHPLLMMAILDRRFSVCSPGDRTCKSFSRFQSCCSLGLLSQCEEGILAFWNVGDENQFPLWICLFAGVGVSLRWPPSPHDQGIHTTAFRCPSLGEAVLTFFLPLSSFTSKPKELNLRCA